MLTQFFTIGTVVLFSAMLPGPDFAMVTKNTLFHSRRSGILTSFGIGAAVLIHISYCALGLAIVISRSPLLFSIIKYCGAAYLIYLGMNSWLSRNANSSVATEPLNQKSPISDFASFRQGFLCNILNPKATMFFLALFTLIIDPETPPQLMLVYLAEILVVVIGWFSVLTIILSHHRIAYLLSKSEKYIAMLLSIFLIGFGLALALVK